MLPEEEIVRDSVEARAILDEQLRRDVTSVAFPWGRNDARVRAALARGGYRIGLGIVGGRSSLRDDPIDLPRIEILGDDDLGSFISRLETRRGSEDDSGQLRPSQLRAQREGIRMTDVPSRDGGADLTPAYMRLLADRVASAIDSLLALQADVLTAIAPSASVQQRLAGMFAIPITDGEGQRVGPYEPIAPGIALGFEQTASAMLKVHRKRFQTVSPETCLNTLEFRFSGASRWLTLEAEIPWSEFAGAERYQLNISAEPDHPINGRVVLRLPQREGGDIDHDIAGYFLAPGRQSSAASGELKLPDINSADTARKPLVLFFFDLRQELTILVHYINLYFA
jgi:hypothetical protein